MHEEITIKYGEALDSFIEKIKKDKYVIAVLLAGSLSYDTVWKKSDIDLIIIVENTKKPYKSYSLVEDEVIINASIFTRYQFKRTFETSLNSGQFHSFISKSKLLFTKDETIKDYYENLFNIGENDKEMLLLMHGTIAVAHLAKAQKWLFVKKDYIYSYFEITRMINTLASIEVIMNDEIPLREVIHQAMKYNNSFFKKIYTDLAQENKNEEVIKEALHMIEKYLEDKTKILFKPLLNLLSDEGMVTGVSELHKSISMKMDIEIALLIEAFEWLVEKNIIEKFSSPIRITTKSRVQVDEAAYFYEGDGEI